MSRFCVGKVFVIDTVTILNIITHEKIEECSEEY